MGIHFIVAAPVLSHRLGQSMRMSPTEAKKLKLGLALCRRWGAAC